MHTGSLRPHTLQVHPQQSAHVACSAHSPSPENHRPDMSDVAYYLPPSSILVSLARSPHSSYCEWKGTATYWNITNPDNNSEVVRNRIWSYTKPTKGFTPIRDYLSFYAGPWDCYVDGEKVEPQPGDFYGGWVTSDIEGPIKGGPGTFGW